MKAWLTVCVVVLLISVFPWMVCGNSSGDGSCAKCHTDAATMKSLVKAPVAAGGEGEG